jgi:outer membrane protein OmpA-like peptidoglycan-associated protein
MNLKKTLFFILIILVQLLNSNFIWGQDKNAIRGDRYYKNREFSNAIYFYQKYLEESNDIITKKKLADCFIQINNDVQAKNIIEQYIDSDQSNSKDYLQYAHLLKRLQNYNEARFWFKKYSEKNPTDKNINQLILSCELIDEMKDDELYIIRPLEINTPQSDFATSIHKNGLLFLSGRENSTSRKIDGRTGDYYLDLYYSEKNAGSFLPATAFDEKLNTKYHEGPACFSPNGKFIYFTRNKSHLNLEGKSELNIYSSRFNGKEWDKPELFKFAGKNYSMGHPCFSDNGRFLFFISDMEGGYGGTDIYLCRKQGFSWSYPINLGPAVNTDGNEMFPYMASDGFLYFASDGHIGLGGLDIFKTTFVQNEWTYPVNIGLPFNSNKDDFGILISPNKVFGYFSSNRNGNDDIFEFSQNPLKIHTLKGRITDYNTKEKLDEVKVTLTENLSKERSTYTDENGNFSFDIFKGINYSIIVQKPEFKTKRILYFPDKSGKTRELQIAMESTQWKLFKGNIIDRYSARPIEKAGVEIVNTTYKSANYIETDKFGDFELKIDPSKRYDIIINKQGYFTKVISNYSYFSDKYEQIELERFHKNELIELYGATFLDQEFELNEKTKEELDQIIQLLKVNPHIAIQIIAYTNKDKGKRKNHDLTKKRAQNAAKYLVNKGITKNRVLYKAGDHSPNKSVLVIKLIEAF